MASDVTLLREIVQGLILELGDEMGPVSFSASDLMKVAGDPGKVGRTAVGSALKVGAKAKTVADVAIKGLPSLVVPFVRARYDRVYAAERKRLGSIERKYPEVFRPMRQIIGDDTQDMKLTAFMVDPIASLGFVAATASTKLVIDVIEALSNDDRYVIDSTSRVKRSLGINVESVIHEADEPNASALMNDERIVAALQASPVVKDIVAAGKEAKNITLNAIIDDAKRIMASETLAELVRVMSGLGMKVSRSAIAAAEYETGEGGDENDVHKRVLKKMRSDALREYVRILGLAVESLTREVGDHAAELQKAYENTIKEISRVSS